jgi:hypothetical protein
MRQPTLALTAAVLIASAAACAEDDGDGLPPPASPPPSDAPSPATSLDPKDAATAEEILAAFDSYMEALVELSTEGVPGGTAETEDRLEEVHVSGEAYDRLAFDLLTENYLAGYATSGKIVWDVVAFEIDWDHTFPANPDKVVPLATLEVCLDESRWTTVDRETDEVVAGPGERYLSAVTVTWRDTDPDRPEREPRWQVSFREDRDEPC